MVFARLELVWDWQARIFAALVQAQPANPDISRKMDACRFGCWQVGSTSSSADRQRCSSALAATAMFDMIKGCKSNQTQSSYE